MPFAHQKSAMHASSGRRIGGGKLSKIENTISSPCATQSMHSNRSSSRIPCFGGLGQVQNHFRLDARSRKSLQRECCPGLRKIVDCRVEHIVPNRTRDSISLPHCPIGESNLASNRFLPASAAQCGNRGDNIIGLG